MYRNEEASDLLNNKLERQSLSSFSTVVGTGDRVLVFSISSCVTEVRHLKSRGFGKWGVFLAQNYVSEQFAN